MTRVMLQDNIWQCIAQFNDFHFIGMRRCSRYFNLLFAPSKSKFLWAVNFDPIELLDLDHHTLSSIHTIDSVFNLIPNQKDEHVYDVFTNACQDSRLAVIKWLINNANFSQYFIQNHIKDHILDLKVVTCILESCQSKDFSKVLDASTMLVALKTERIPVLNWLHERTWNFMVCKYMYLAKFNEMCTSGLIQSAKWISEHYIITQEDGTSSCGWLDL